MKIPVNTGEFAKEFKDFHDCFVVVGGTPTALYIEQRGKGDKTTKDLDIVVLDVGISEKSEAFLIKFKKYVDDNGYETTPLSAGKSQSYRFSEPKTALAPKIIEIASERQMDIPAKQAAQRLDEFEMSAIVCEKYFIDLLKLYTEPFQVDDENSIPVPKPTLLIVMKAYAALNLEKSDGANDKSKYRKHLNDIARLANNLIDSDAIKISAEALAHLDELLGRKEEHFPEARLRECGWGDPKAENLEKVIRSFISK